MDEPELHRLLAELESDRSERTISKEKTDKFGEAICAFANDLPHHRLPGYLFVGANEDGTASGSTVTDELLLKLAGIRTDGNLLPAPRMVPLSLEVRKPVFDLKAADGAIGNHATTVKDAARTFEMLAREIAARTGVDIPP